MAQTRLLKRVEDLELWTTVGATAQHFAVKAGDRRARVVATLEEAEALFSVRLGRMREARAH
jgi:hypothetical protein